MQNCDMVLSVNVEFILIARGVNYQVRQLSIHNPVNCDAHMLF